MRHVEETEHGWQLTQLHRLRGVIEWDREKGQATNAPEANRFIRRPAYRKGWEFKA